MLRSFRIVASIMLLAAVSWAATLPAGTQVKVRLGQTISSATARPGQAWEGTLAAPVVVNGKTVARTGAPVKGIVADAKPSGRLSSPGVVKLRVTSIRMNGTETPVRSSARLPAAAKALRSAPEPERRPEPWAPQRPERRTSRIRLNRS